jgi:hypothetical protein
LAIKNEKIEQKLKELLADIGEDIHSKAFERYWKAKNWMRYGPDQETVLRSPSEEPSAEEQSSAQPAPSAQAA